MGFEFNPELLKKHPYATGSVVIVGGLIVFYLLSRSGGSRSAAPVSASSGNSANNVAADLQLAQIQAGVAVQTNAQNVQAQQNQLQADVANKQVDAQLASSNLSTLSGLITSLFSTKAAVEENATNQTAATTQQANQLSAQTTQQANELTYAQNLQQMQDAVLNANINAGLLAHESDNQTALIGQQNQLDYLHSVAQIQGDLAQTVSNNQTALSQHTLDIVGQAGLNHGTESLESSLVQTVAAALGQPAVAVASSQAQIANAQSSAISDASMWGSIGKIGSTIAAGLI